MKVNMNIFLNCSWLNQMLTRFIIAWNSFESKNSGNHQIINKMWNDEETDASPKIHADGWWEIIYLLGVALSVT